VGRVDPALPFLERAFAPGEMLRFFNEDVLPGLGSRERVEAVGLRRVSWEPGRRAQLLFALEPGSGRTHVPPFAVVSVRKASELEQAARQRAQANPETAGSLVMPEASAIVELFPCDWRLPGLAMATDPASMAPVLKEALGSQEGLECRVLRYQPHVRCVLEWSAASGRRLVAKVYAKPAKADKVWDVLGRLADLPAPRPFRSPSPVARLPEQQVVVMEWLAGLPVRDLVLAPAPGGPAPEDVVAAAAEALSALHGVPGTGLEPLALADARARTVKRAAELEPMAGRFARRVRSLLERIADREAELSKPRRVFLHGSASPKQMLIAPDASGPGRVGLIDFDAVRAGDPALDVGTFMAALHKYAVKRRDPGRLRALADHFLAVYADNAGDAELEYRARLVPAQELTHYSARGFGRPGGSRTGSCDPFDILDEAEACLERS
jgi:aminoglycoside phosphotransferase (APT) family kinase protein